MANECLRLWLLACRTMAARGRFLGGPLEARLGGVVAADARDRIEVVRGGGEAPAPVPFAGGAGGRAGRRVREGDLAKVWAVEEACLAP